MKNETLYWHYVNFQYGDMVFKNSLTGEKYTRKTFEGTLKSIYYDRSPYGKIQINFEFYDKNLHKYIFVGNITNQAILALTNYLASITNYGVIKIKCSAKKSKINDNYIYTHILVYNNDKRLSWKIHKCQLPKIKRGEYSNDKKFQSFFSEMTKYIKYYLLKGVVKC